MDNNYAGVAWYERNDGTPYCRCKNFPTVAQSRAWLKQVRAEQKPVSWKIVQLSTGEVIDRGPDGDYVFQMVPLWVPGDETE
jgi:hypothetical protein